MLKYILSSFVDYNLYKRYNKLRNKVVDMDR